MEIGQLIGRFRVQKPIGRGGMANVYLALDTGKFRQVALKILPRTFATNKMLVARFLREMEVCRALSHPNLVAFVDGGLDNDQYYLAQEFISGTSLGEMISRTGPLDIRLALSVMQDSSFGLHAVHQQKIIHRDLKPQNVMITTDQVIKLIDFGIAFTPEERITQLICQELERLGIRYRMSELRTDPGTVIGTPCYNSPEQNQGKELTYSSDIYSLGLIYYEAFTGVQVLPNTSLNKIIDFQAELDEKLIPVSKVNPQIPKGIDEVIQRMVRYRPEHRFQTASELVIALKRLNLQLDGTTVAQGGGNSKRLAELEVFETSYWRAVNHLSAAAYLEALSEFESILDLDVVEVRYREGILENLNFLTWVLQPTQTPKKGKNFRIAVEEYVRCLIRIMSIYIKLGLPSHCQLVARRFVKTLAEMSEYDRALEFYDQAFIAMPNDLVIKRGYAALLYTNGATSAARCAQFEVVRQLYSERRYEGAYQDLSKVLQFEPDNTQVQDELSQLRTLLQRRAQERDLFLKKVDAMLGTREPTFFQAAYEQFLSRFPEDLEVMERSLNLSIDLNQESKTRELLLCMGRLLFEAEPDLAKERFVKALLVDSRDSQAINYLIEIFRDAGVSFEEAEGYRDVVIRLYTMIGFYKEAIVEYERKLRGSLADLTIYDRVVELYRKTGHTAKIPQLFFQMGECALRNNRPDLSREYFDEAIERCKDKDAIFDQLRKVPNINRVYDLMKLVYSRTTRMAGTESPGAQRPKKGEEVSGLIQRMRGSPPRAGNA